MNDNVGSKTVLSYLYVCPSNKRNLYACLDFGRKWQLVYEHVNRFYLSVTGLDNEPDLVDMEAHTPKERIQYVTCRALTCSEPNRNYPFPGYIDISSLVVQDDYMFIQVTTAVQASYYVSYQRDPFLNIKLPKYSLPKLQEEAGFHHWGARTEKSLDWDERDLPSHRGGSAKTPEVAERSAQVGV
ncbi:VPS10 domain-containing receptor SorCS1-like [Salvelinus alpinus]